MIRSSAATDSPRNPLEETTSRSLTRVAVDLLHPAVARSGPGLADGLQAQLDAAARLQVFQREAAPVLPEADLLQHAQNPQLVALLDTYETPSSLILVLEL